MKFQILSITLFLVIGCHSSPSKNEDPGTLAVLCYSCTWNPNDQRCLTDPTSVPNPTVSCTYPNPWCYIQRREYKDNPGVLHELTRGCTDRQQNYKDVNDHWITHVTSCNSNTCNSGPGYYNAATDTIQINKTNGLILATLAFVARIVL